jgi:DNA-directed RNA polymerase specialized sigma24 family protein
MLRSQPRRDTGRRPHPVPAGLADLAAIKPHDRRTLYLMGLGYRYREIMEITGVSYTAFNRRITEGRRALRKLERERKDIRESR